MSFQFKPALEALGDRVVMSCTVIQSAWDPNIQGTMVSVTGDQDADSVKISDYGNGEIDVTATGFGTKHFSDVTKIVVNTEGNNDTVNYDLLGSLQKGQHQYVVVGLGSNNDPTNRADSFEATIHAGVVLNSDSRLDVIGMGGAGNDFLNFYAGNVNMASNARMKIQMGGGNGDDVVRETYTGINDGIITMRAYGDEGSDGVGVVVDAAAGSDGYMNGLVWGGNPNIKDTAADSLVMSLNAPTTMTTTGELYMSTQDWEFHTSTVNVHLV